MEYAFLMYLINTILPGIAMLCTIIFIAGGLVLLFLYIVHIADGDRSFLAQAPNLLKRLALVAAISGFVGLVVPSSSAMKEIIAVYAGAEVLTHPPAAEGATETMTKAHDVLNKIMDDYLAGTVKVE